MVLAAPGRPEGRGKQGYGEAQQGCEKLGSAPSLLDRRPSQRIVAGRHNLAKKRLRAPQEAAQSCPQLSILFRPLWSALLRGRSRRQHLHQCLGESLCHGIHLTITALYRQCSRALWPLRCWGQRQAAARTSRPSQQPAFASKATGRSWSPCTRDSRIAIQPKGRERSSSERRAPREYSPR